METLYEKLLKVCETKQAPQELKEKVLQICADYRSQYEHIRKNHMALCVLVGKIQEEYSNMPSWETYNQHIVPKTNLLKGVLSSSSEILSPQRRFVWYSSSFLVPFLAVGQFSFIGGVLASAIVLMYARETLQKQVLGLFNTWKYEAASIDIMYSAFFDERNK